MPRTLDPLPRLSRMAVKRKSSLAHARWATALLLRLPGMAETPAI